MTYMNGLPGSYTGMDKFRLGGSFSTQLDHCCHHQDAVSTLFRNVQRDILHVRNKRTLIGKTCAVKTLKTNTLRTFKSDTRELTIETTQDTGYISQPYLIVSAYKSWTQWPSPR